MNEPRSTTDAGPVPVPDAATASTPDPAPAPAAEREPEVRPEPGPAPARDPDTAEDTLAEHVARTDAALVAWRKDAERRRAAWEEAQARAIERMRAQRRRVVRIAAATGLVGIGIGFAAGVLFYRTWWLGGPQRGAALEPPPSAVAPVAEAASAAEPEGQPAPEPEATASPGPEPPLFAVIDGSARVWTEGTHTWASFDTTEAGDVSLRYLDGAGAAALDPMDCQGPGADGIRRCSAGRSADRIASAVREGAAPGTWTVQGCGPRGCVSIGTFEVPAP